MKRVVAALLLLGSLSFPADKKRKSPEVEVVEVTAKRVEGNVDLDGKVKNVSEKTYAGLVLVFDFGAAAHQVISSTKAVLEVETLAPQEEVEFHVKTQDLPRAVEITVRAEDKHERVLRVDKAGPYPIE